jgi:hypothetical protein
MKLTSLLRAALLPLTEVSVLLPLLMFWAVVSFGTWRLPLGAIVLILALPPLFRYQSIVLESCAKGNAPGVFDAEFFDWIGSMWTIFSLPLALAFLMGGVYAGEAWGDVGAWSVIALAAVIFPASLALLTISHSLLEALNPFAITRLYRRAFSTFWIAPLYFLAAIWLSIQAEALPMLAAIFIQLFLFFSFAALTGALIQPFNLISDVSIPDAIEKDEQTIAGDIEAARELALGHAYGFISRDNRAGGFSHIMDEIKKDPDPAGAWAWYFNHMLNWENNQHAMFFGQHHVADMLDHGEDIPALKAIMRCRLIDEAFKPFPEDVARAISAAETHRNIELAAVLKRG